MGLFSIFLYTFAINCVTSGARKKPIEYMICFIYSQQCITIISSLKMCGFIRSVFKKITPNTCNTTPTYQEVGGVLNPIHFVDGIRTPHGIVLTIPKLIDFYSQGVFTFLFSTVFN